MSWAARRKALYLLGVAVFFAVVIGVPLMIYLYQPPTCFDGIMNQDETAIDLGGPCDLRDPRTLTPYAVLWARPFFVRDGVYSAAAYIENPNADTGILEAPYRFRLYDDKNVLVAEREGTTYVAPGTITPVFERQLETGSRQAARAFFEFGQPLVWQRLEDKASEIGVANKILEAPDTEPRISAVVKNNGVARREKLTVVAIVFDTTGNAFAASQTILDSLEGGEAREVVFTWPERFERQVARVDVVPSVPPTPPR